MRLRLLDLDTSLTEQVPFAAGVRQGLIESVDLRSMGPGLRVIATRRGIARFVAALDQRFGAPDGVPDVYFYGSGDFHHLTAALLSRLAEPVTVVHFDNHPDWCRFPATFNCGAWVNRALELPHVTRMITIGPASRDLVRPELQSANLAAISDGRLELYPWIAQPSRVWRRYRDSACSRQIGGYLHWRNLADESWPAFLDELEDRLPRTALWITIDKDVLGPVEATTNWDQGAMPLGHVTAAVERLAARYRIAGIDVCGDHSTPVFADPVRAVIARLDNPPGPPPGADAVAVNAAANARLIAAIERALTGMDGAQARSRPNAVDDAGLLVDRRLG